MWFLLLTESGGLVCFVTVGGVYVYAVECISMCVGLVDWSVGLFPPLFETHVCLFLGAGQLLGGQPFALYVGALIPHLVGCGSTHLSVCHPRPGSAAGGSSGLSSPVRYSVVRLL